MRCVIALSSLLVQAKMLSDKMAHEDVQRARRLAKAIIKAGPENRFSAALFSNPSRQELTNCSKRWTRRAADIFIRRSESVHTWFQHTGARVAFAGGASCA
jgi:hypothetical protein